MPAASAYGRMRLRWCLATLLAFLRRWGAYIAVGLLVLGGSGDSAIDAMKALAAWTVRPLVHAAAQPAWLAATGALAHAMAGALVVWGLRPLLWPRAWGDAERALPIPPAQTRRSDALVVTTALLPLFGTYLAGALVWAVESRGRLPNGLAAAGWLLVSMGVSVVAGIAILQRMRRAPRPAAAAQAPVRSSRGPGLRLPAWWALVLLPLWRGPARRSGRLLVASALLLPGLGLPIAFWPGLAAWWLGALAALGLLATSRLVGLVTLELAPLHREAVALPIAPTRLRAWRRVVALLPLSVALAVSVPVAVLRVAGLRPAVLCAFALVAWGGAAWQVMLSTTPASLAARAEDPAARVAGWLFTLVLLLALASEVVR